MKKILYQNEVYSVKAEFPSILNGSTDLLISNITKTLVVCKGQTRPIETLDYLPPKKMKIADAFVENVRE